MKPINRMIDAVVRCTLCGKSQCECWVRCGCGWLHERDGGKCRNPECAALKGETENVCPHCGCDPTKNEDHQCLELL